jgi:hypothetical protein
MGPVIFVLAGITSTIRIMIDSRPYQTKLNNTRKCHERLDWRQEGNNDTSMPIYTPAAAAAIGTYHFVDLDGIPLRIGLHAATFQSCHTRR